MNDAPRFARAEMRQARDICVAGGYEFNGYDTKGHPEYVHPSGARESLPQTPRAYSLRRLRQRVDRANGIKRSSTPNLGKGKAMPARRTAADTLARSRYLAEVAERDISAANRARADRIRGRILDNDATVHAIHQGMRNLSTVRQRAYAETAITHLLADNIALSEQLAAIA